MSECTHDCGSCSAGCGEQQEKPDFRVPVNQFSHVDKVIGVVSGKGGVGKPGDCLFGLRDACQGL